MKDIVLAGFVQSFAESQGYTTTDEAEIFEAFSVSTVLRKFHHSDPHEWTDFVTDDSKDGGIDALAILVNGRPARSTEDVDFFIDKLKRLDVEFVFVQSKTTPSFSAADIGTFVYGVAQFFSPNPQLQFNAEIESLRVIKDYIYQKSIVMEENPRCFLYYVTTGSWEGAHEPTVRFNDGKAKLEQTKLFSEVATIPIDLEKLKAAYRDLERRIVKEVEFSRIAVFPRVEGVSEAYIGLMSGDQFLHLVETEDALLNRELFYDNVRDFQGNNPVNDEIKRTLDESESRGRFPLLNNGVTIVARSINRTGDAFKISDFQIVNGCQSTHVLFQNRNIIDNNTFIPVKIIVTNDSAIINEVIKATNRQTAVLPEALESLTPFHKELEDFYNAKQAGVESKNRVYYERRSKQYAFDRIPPSNIVTLTSQTKSFVAMYLNEPHSQHRYYGELLKAYESRLFVNEHRPSSYYASGYALLAVEKLFNSGQLDKSMKVWRYHLLMMLRVEIAGAEVPRLNSRAADQYAIKIVEALSDDAVCQELCENALAQIKNQLALFKSTAREPKTRLRAFTADLLNAAGADSAGSEVHAPKFKAIGVKEAGKLRWFDNFKNFGFIERKTGEDVFVHGSYLKDVPWRLRVEGTALNFTIGEGREPGTVMAIDVTVID